MLLESVSETQAEQILNRVHMAMLHEDPQWQERVLKAKGDLEDKKLTALQIEAYKRVCRVNDLKFTPKAEFALAFHLRKAGAKHLARFIVGKAQFDQDVRSSIPEEESGQT